MPFFTKVNKVSQKKKKSGKNVAGKTDKNTTLKRKFQERLEEQLSRDNVESSSDDETLQQVKKWKENDDIEEGFREEDVETPAQLKERLAQNFLEELKDQKEAQDAEKDVGQQLREDVLQSQGKLFRKVAYQYKQDSDTTTTVLQCKKFQRKVITCVAINNQDGSIFSSSLDGSIVKYSSSGEKLGVIKSKFQDSEGIRHSKAVNSIALSTDGKYLASGDAAGTIHVWDPSTLSHLDTLETKHRGSVTGLAFQRGAHALYSCSTDRLVMEWDVDSMAYVDNLGGHSSGVQAIDALYRQSCITCGGEDETVIIYSILEDKQFQFTSKQTSVDGVKLLNETTFLTYGQDGSLCLWATNRKKPLQSLRAAHGCQTGGTQEPNWITALATLVNTDLVASGSSDGFIRLWRVTIIQGTGTLRALCRVPVPKGTVNSLEFTCDGTSLVAGIGRSHKLGRWFVEKKAKSLVYLIKFNNVKPLKISSVNKYMEQNRESGNEETDSDDDSDDDSGVGNSDEVLRFSGKLNSEQSNEDEQDEQSDEDEQDELSDEDVQNDQSDDNDQDNESDAEDQDQSEHSNSGDDDQNITDDET